jgi:SAM-dependent methyltransferase
VLDLDHLDGPAASFDVVFCRDGLQFALDPAAAVAGIGRLLRPRGRAVLAVWGPQADNPWLGLAIESVGAELGMPIPPHGLPGPFSLGDADALAQLLGDAGLGDVAVEELDEPMQPPSFDAWWAMTTSLAGPVAVMLGQLPEPTRTAIRERARAATAPYEVDGVLRLPGLALVASGRRG